MITIIDAEKLYFDNNGWNRVHRIIPINRFHEQKKADFGSFLTINDYTVYPGFGYDMHPHQNREIIFFVIDGELTSRDIGDNSVVMRKNFVQEISSGSGYAHSNYNYGDSPARYIGVWLLPKEQNGPPASSVREYDPALWHGRFHPIASGLPGHADAGNEPPIPFNAAATLYRAVIENSGLSFAVAEGQKALLYIIDGELDCNGETMKKRYHARITGEESLQLRSDGKAECILVVM